MYGDAPTIHVTIEQTVNLGNYQSAKVVAGISRLPFNADEETIQQALETQKIVFSKLTDKMRDQISRLRREEGE